MLDSSDIRCLVLSLRWWFMELFFVCADLLRWVPIFLRTVYSAQFCLHRCWSSPMLSHVFKMLSVDWYVRNRIKHVHPVSDGNSRCRLGAARHSTTSRVLPAQSASRVTVRHGMNVPDSLCPCFSWWRHQMETFPALLALCEGNPPRPVTRSFDVFFDLRLNKRLSKQSMRRWFNTPSRSLWSHCDVTVSGGQHV